MGGLAGDMFVAALLDAFPEYESTVIANIQALNGAYPVACSLIVHADRFLRGRRFEVKPLARRGASGADGEQSFAPAQSSWQSIRRSLENSSLDPDVRAHAVGIFTLLAEAEASVHGIETDRVVFDEEGVWDSIADIVGAATLIHATGAARWTSSPAPLGSGRVRTARGILPVPAPATTHLLLGMPTIDDGIEGERLTPTGAAILRYLCHPSGGGGGLAPKTRRLVCSGTGFGSRVLPNVSNHVRVLCFEEIDHGAGRRRQFRAPEFEENDQSGDDLAAGLDRLRRLTAFLDVAQS